MVSATGTNLQEVGTTTVGAVTVDYYINWEEAASYICPSGQAKACALEISSMSVYNFGGSIGRRIVADQRNGSIGVSNYIMHVINGCLETISPFSQYKIIDPNDNVSNYISIKNRSWTCS